MNRDSLHAARAAFLADPGAGARVAEYAAAARTAGGLVGAVDALEEALAAAASPGAALEARYLLAANLRELGDIERAYTLMESVCAARDDRALDQFKVSLALYRKGADEAFLADLRGWYYARERARRPFVPLRMGGPRRDRPLRTAFLGWDPVIAPYAALMIPLFRALDPAKIDVRVIVPDAPEAALAPLRALGIAASALAVGEPWTGDQQAIAAKTLAALELDVLIDLGDCLGPTASIPLHRVAPIQVTWQNMLGPCPDPVYDALIGNAALYPPDPIYAGKARRLPDDLFVYDPHCFAAKPPTVAPAPCLANGFVTFGALSSLYKMGEASLALWAKVLRAVPSARLRLGNGGLADSSARARVLATLMRHGADPARVEFGAPQGWPGYLDAYAGIDVALASVPVAGGTTMFEAVYQGVPVLSRVHPTPLGRIGRWLEAAIGRPGTAHDTDESLIATAKAWAADPAGLASWRASARAYLDAKSTIDAARQARAFEAILFELAGR
jgi:protein O-GlcNAc transferase